MEKVQYKHVPNPTLHQVITQINLVRDKFDVPVALTAIQNHVDYLISSDADLNAKDKTTATLDALVTVMKPREFMEWMKRKRLT